MFRSLKQYCSRSVQRISSGIAGAPSIGSHICSHWNKCSHRQLGSASVSPFAACTWHCGSVKHDHFSFYDCFLSYYVGSMGRGCVFRWDLLAIIYEYLRMLQFFIFLYYFTPFSFFIIFSDHFLFSVEIFAQIWSVRFYEDILLYAKTDLYARL
jgi:hypothetical protein